MLELLKKLNSEKYDIVTGSKKYYGIKILEEKDNFLLVETRPNTYMLINIASVTTITPAKDIAYGTIAKNIRF
ncbi:hypothetical protein [Fusobacterium sp.]|uniref:hypothetical protein n=1 Tax=Fusobacterium sp. TaxID=68766 RepID=UPI002618E419|nr:hypothetical protein [Fusobacterium sp.]